MRVVGESGSDPDAKPVCGIPRAERRAVAVAHSFGAWQERRLGSGRDANEGPAGQQDGGPEAPMIIDRARPRRASARWKKTSKKHIKSRDGSKK